MDPASIAAISVAAGASVVATVSAIVSACTAIRTKEQSRDNQDNSTSIEIETSTHKETDGRKKVLIETKKIKIDKTSEKTIEHIAKSSIPVHNPTADHIGTAAAGALGGIGSIINPPGPADTVEMVSKVIDGAGTVFTEYRSVSEQKAATASPAPPPRTRDLSKLSKEEEKEEESSENEGDADLEANLEAYEQSTQSDSSEHNAEDNSGDKQGEGEYSGMPLSGEGDSPAADNIEG